MDVFSLKYVDATSTCILKRLLSIPISKPKFVFVSVFVKTQNFGNSMASPNQIQSLSSQNPTAFLTHLKKPTKFHNQIKVTFKFVACSTSSPFTEKHSLQRYQRENWAYSTNNDSSPSPQPQSSSNNRREDDIVSQLPELRKLLDVLREKREKQIAGNVNDGVIGEVFLVGTGPGDPDLLTLKAVKVMQSADLLLYDRLVSNDVLEMVGSNARMLYVGKTAGYHSRTQEEIHQLLLSFAQAGANVVRLKGGDPLVFGRGGEEMDFLQQKGIHVKVIPGITAASGIAAELGIPLTHRGVATSVRYLTGHSRNGGTDPLFVAENAADPDTTLVIYMGLATLPSLAQKLVQHGLPTDTPAVAVEKGTTSQQRLVFAELKDLADKIKYSGLVSPTLIIIGKVVALSPMWIQSSEELAEFVEAK